MSISFRTIALAATALGGALIAGPAFTQGTGTTIARYTLDAGTISGMGAMGRGGGGGIGAAMEMMRGGAANAEAHELQLRLGTTRAPTGAPKADHTLPQTARFGPVLPLRTPPLGRSTDNYTPPEMPRGRLLLFWGCGEKAGPGQPVVIDFAKLVRGQVPPGLYAKPLAIAEEWRITQANSRTYGEWPHGEDRQQVPSNASLLGAHKVAGNYTPDIAFTLDQDFMAPISLASRAQPSGAYALSWNAVPAATGYYAWAFSAKGERGGGTGDIVWWTSSASQAFGGPMWDWLSPAAVRQLIAARTVMPPSQTTCTVPAEVRQAGGEVTMTSLYAYGPERNFSYPPRPANARAGWQPDWIARARFRSMTMAMLGMDMGAMGGDQADAGQETETEPAKPKKPKCRGGLAGIAQRAAGLCE
ncbi:MAG TPA: hypothetical protein VFS87_07985 [Qipengyuania sp.]|nr:hypothetical protein [Qipengyuania sp.]